jgi:hypothetical protein
LHQLQLFIFTTVYDLLERMNAAQDRLLDHLNDPTPSAMAVLSTFEETHSAMRAVAEAVKFHKSNPAEAMPDGLQQALALGAQFGALMLRVKQHLDNARLV